MGNKKMGIKLNGPDYFAANRSIKPALFIVRIMHKIEWALL